MMELPEALTVARQMQGTLMGQAVTGVQVQKSPHKFAFFSMEPADYARILAGKEITGAAAHGSWAELQAENATLTFNDGANLRYYAPGEVHPEKHQLLLGLSGGGALVVTVQMYAGIQLFTDGNFDNIYYNTAKTKPSPLTDAFDEAYFSTLLDDKTKKLSAKAFLATEQRIPGLGNGVLQDILWRAKIHPKRKMSTVGDAEFAKLYATVKAQLADMAEKGGRDTEKDLFGVPGGYHTVMQKKNDGMPCPVCGGLIKRMAYLGGNVYVCEGCQKV